MRHHNSHGAMLGAALLLAFMAPSASALYRSTELDLSLQSRYFQQPALRAEQSDFNVSLAAEGELFLESDDRNHSLTIHPFARWDNNDDERTHFDLREAYWQGLFGDLEVRLGLVRVFWGKTESLHLVDTINQVDGVEDVDGEDRLGQPMLRLSQRLGPGSLQGYLLPWFRERTFPGPDGRLSTPLPVNDDAASYASDDEESHLDYALRYQGWLGGLDFGLSWFDGTNRNPQLLPGGFAQTPQGPQPTELHPFYGQIEQLSLDAQYTAGSALWKLEALARDEDIARPQPDGSQRLGQDRYAAAVAGLEYTLYGIAGSAADLGLLAEYLWDERGRDGPSSFQNDAFVGARWAANDVRGTAVLAGAVVDLDHGAVFGLFEASLRLNGSSSLSLESRLFSNVSPEDQQLFTVRNDDYTLLQLNYFF